MLIKYVTVFFLLGRDRRFLLVYLGIVYIKSRESHDNLQPTIDLQPLRRAYIYIFIPFYLLFQTSQSFIEFLRKAIVKRQMANSFHVNSSVITQLWFECLECNIQQSRKEMFMMVMVTYLRHSMPLGY